jgi:hypothetical protein
VRVLLNSGGVTPFADHKAYDAGKGIQGLAVGDLNGDGKLDLATVNAASEIRVFLNKGEGVLEHHASYKCGESPQSIAIMDINRDSRLDLVVANKKTKDLSMFINTGDGNFGEEKRHELRTEPSALYAANFDADEKGDDLALVADGSALTVLINIYGKK